MDVKKQKNFLFKSFFIATIAFTIFVLWQQTVKILGIKELPLSEENIILSPQTRDDLQKVVLQNIEKAQHSIFLVIYSLRDKAVLHALAKKALEGVEVQVFCDRKASKAVAKKLGPFVKTHYHDHQGLHHRKILIIDDHIVWIGSANMTTESLKYYGNAVIGFDNHLLAESIQAFTLKEKVSNPIIISAANQEIELWMLPSYRALEKLIDIIRTAKKRLQIAQFTWTNASITEAVIEAHKNDVIIEAVIERSTIKAASKKTAEKLIENDVPIAISDGSSLLHHKLAIVDDETLIIGSANWTRSAFTKNDDCFVIIRKMTPKQKKKVQNLWHAIWCESKDLPKAIPQKSF